MGKVALLQVLTKFAISLSLIIFPSDLAPLGSLLPLWMVRCSCVHPRLYVQNTREHARERKGLLLLSGVILLHPNRSVSCSLN